MREKQMLKKQKGITLVALVVTIVILIILSTVAINATFGENGLIKRAEEAKNMAEGALKNEEQEIANAVAYMNEMLGDNQETDNSYVDNSIAVAPKLSDGMVPVKWDEEKQKWVKTTKEDSEWYNYAEKKWANVVLTPTSGEKEGKDATGAVDVFNEDGTLNENSAYSMLVWIPRYAYQITSKYHQGGTDAGNINIVFIDTKNQNKDKTKTYNETYPKYEAGTGMEDYVVHPAFNYGETKLPGFWVGKYETSNTNCDTTASTGEYNGTDRTVTIKPNVTSWRSITVSNIFTVCTNLNKEKNPYGLNTSDTVVDPHMMKNTEWGAVAYLSQNLEYGKGSEVWINNSSDYITGNAGSSVSSSSTSGTTNEYNTSNGMQASTTGNTTGVYDMSGGTYEYVAAYVNNGHENLTINGEALINADVRYKDVYQASGTTNGNDNQEQNYNLSTPEKGKYGDAVYETSSSYSSSNSWYSDYSAFPYSSAIFFIRGGYCIGGSNTGVLNFSNIGGISNSDCTFRLVLPVM